MTSVYDFSARAIDGADVSLDRFRGQALLIVNTASKCGFTGQYDGLEKLRRDFADAPFEVLGFPCNQFGQQEPCLLYTSPSPRDLSTSRMPSSA